MRADAAAADPCPFTIFQMSTSPVVGLYQAISLVPSPSKSPVSDG